MNCQLGRGGGRGIVSVADHRVILSTIGFGDIAQIEDHIRGTGDDVPIEPPLIKQRLRAFRRNLERDV